MYLRVNTKQYIKFLLATVIYNKNLSYYHLRLERQVTVKSHQNELVLTIESPLVLKGLGLHDLVLANLYPLNVIYT